MKEKKKRKSKSKYRAFLRDYFYTTLVFVIQILVTISIGNITKPVFHECRVRNISKQSKINCFQTFACRTFEAVSRNAANFSIIVSTWEKQAPNLANIVKSNNIT